MKIKRPELSFLLYPVIFNPILVILGLILSIISVILGLFNVKPHKNHWEITLNPRYYRVIRTIICWWVVLIVNSWYFNPPYSGYIGEYWAIKLIKGRYPEQDKFDLERYSKLKKEVQS